MKTFRQFLHEYRRDNFLNVRDVGTEQAYEYFKGALKDLGYDINIAFPNFVKNYKLVLTKLRRATTPRKEMPVIKSVDIDKFLAHLRSEKIGVKSTQMVAKNLIPMQNQIYLDNPINAITQHKLTGTIDFAKNKSHSIVSSDNYIMDGNHRWLLVMLYDPSMKIHVHIVNMKRAQLKGLMDHFTDHIAKRQRNESTT